MTTEQNEWMRVRELLVGSIVSLGFPEELGNEVAKQLGSPKAMERMRGYLLNVKPTNVELVVDEMLAIRSEIESWREKKACEESNVRMNELLNYGLEDDE